MNKPMTATEVLERSDEMRTNPPIGSEVWLEQQRIKTIQKQLLDPLIWRALKLLRKLPTK